MALATPDPTVAILRNTLNASLSSQGGHRLYKQLYKSTVMPSSEAFTVYFYYGLEVKIPHNKLFMLEADLKWLKHYIEPLNTTTS